MTLAEALQGLPVHMRKTFTFDVQWWVTYQDYTEQAAVQRVRANMQGEDVLYRRPWGALPEHGHWCRGWYYCFRCYGN